ncbi:MAG TPA: alpha/beta fold hydrolase [Thermoanaerobaculia bacterium]|nr:alpha/beta fold hydrolase [Thermoanaerobaculia bacterium]
MERIAVLEEGREVSHLAVRFDLPEGKAGGGEPLCFLYLHGFGSVQSGEKAEFFRRAAREAGYAFCSFDFQGHGESGGTMRELTLSRNLADLELVWRYLAARGHERICLLGSSMGGGTGLWFSALHPERVVAGLHIALALELERGLLAWAGPEGARAWEASGAIDFKNDFVTCELGWGLIEDLRAHPMEELLSRYRTPALLLQGKRDDSVPWQTVVDFAVRCPYEALDLHLFADGDHRLTDRKERLWELMLEFLKGRGLL